LLISGDLVIDRSAELPEGSEPIIRSEDHQSPDQQITKFF
jgi:hypothetical protein